MYIYVNIYIYIHMHKYVCTCTRMYLRTHTYRKNRLCIFCRRVESGAGVNLVCRGRLISSFVRWGNSPLENVGKRERESARDRERERERERLTRTHAHTHKHTHLAHCLKMWTHCWNMWRGQHDPTGSAPWANHSRGEQQRAQSHPHLTPHCLCTRGLRVSTGTAHSACHTTNTLCFVCVSLRGGEGRESVGRQAGRMEEIGRDYDLTYESHTWYTLTITHTHTRTHTRWNGQHRQYRETHLEPITVQSAHVNIPTIHQHTHPPSQAKIHAQKRRQTQTLTETLNTKSHNHLLTHSYTKTHLHT